MKGRPMHNCPMQVRPEPGLVLLRVLDRLFTLDKYRAFWKRRPQVRFNDSGLRG